MSDKKKKERDNEIKEEVRRREYNDITRNEL